MAENDQGNGEADANDGQQQPLTAEDLALADALDGQKDGQQNNEGGKAGEQNQQQGQNQQQDQQQNNQQSGDGQQQKNGGHGGGQQQGQQQQDQQPASFRDLVSAIEDESLRNVAGRYNSFNDVVKSIVDLRTDNSKRIKPPDANSTDEDKAKWRKAIGVPETPTGDTGYKITPPEGIELTDADTGLINAILPVAHQNEVPAVALNGFVGELLKASRTMEAEAVKAIKDYGDSQEAALKKEWGNDYDANYNLAKRVVDVVGGDSLKAVFNTVKVEGGGLLGDHPDVLKFLANLGRRMDEGDLMIGSTKEERVTAQQELDELNKTVPIGSAGYRDKAHQTKLQALYEKLHGNAPIVGGQNRAA